jgi:hypothetical protein
MDRIPDQGQEKAAGTAPAAFVNSRKLKGELTANRRNTTRHATVGRLERVHTLEQVDHLRLSPFLKRCGSDKLPGSIPCPPVFRQARITIDLGCVTTLQHGIIPARFRTHSLRYTTEDEVCQFRIAIFAKRKNSKNNSMEMLPSTREIIARSATARPAGSIWDGCAGAGKKTVISTAPWFVSTAKTPTVTVTGILITVTGSAKGKYYVRFALSPHSHF